MAQNLTQNVTDRCFQTYGICVAAPVSAGDRKCTKGVTRPVKLSKITDDVCLFKGLNHRRVSLEIRQDKLRVHRYTFEPRTARSCLSPDFESKTDVKLSQKIRHSNFTTNTFLLATPFAIHIFLGRGLCVHDNMGNFQYFQSHFLNFSSKVCVYCTQKPKEIPSLFSKGRTPEKRRGILSDTTEWIYDIRKLEFAARPSVQHHCGANY